MSPLLGGKWHWMISYDCLPLAHCYIPFILLTYFTEWLIFFSNYRGFLYHMHSHLVLFYFETKNKILSCHNYKWESVAARWLAECWCIVVSIAVVADVFSDNSITVETAARYSATNALTWRWCCRHRRSLFASVTRATLCYWSDVPPTEMTDCRLRWSPSVSNTTQCCDRQRGPLLGFR